MRARLRPAVEIIGLLLGTTYVCSHRYRQQDERKPKRPVIHVERECPYALHSEEDAMLRINDPALHGNVVTVENLTFGRTGNHFTSLFYNMALGYCCKSKLVSLPPKDDVLAPGVFNEGSSGPRWFDFSRAPDVPGFDSSSCSADITWAGPKAFHMHQLSDHKDEFYTPGLRECISRAPRLLGCEAAYYFPKGIDLCHAGAAAAHPDVTFDDEPEPGQHEEGQQRGGSLVVHVRSGDIFDDAVLKRYGQPPLQFYLQVLRHTEWDRVDIVTNSPNERNLNPVIPVLQAKVAAGEFPSTVHVHTNRTMEQDLLSMMCADGLALARSTLTLLTGWHSKAKRLYVGKECNTFATDLALQRPDIQVFGLNSQPNYSVNVKWQNTPEQRTEMLTYDKIDGFNQC